MGYCSCMIYSDIVFEIETIQCEGSERAHADRTIVNTSRLQALLQLYLQFYLFVLKPYLFLSLAIHSKIRMIQIRCFLDTR